MNEDLQALLAAKSEWSSLQPLQPDREKRLWQKLRLEWNYHSNHIEGNTLTYGETELLLLHDQTHGTHDIREYVEMKAHDLGIEHLRKLAADPERGLSETDIRDLNEIILKEPFWKPTETADGQPTRKQIIPGEYKTTPNNVRTATGEVFEFAAPNEVPAKMKALVDWLWTELEGPMEDIAMVAAKLHHDFVLIHPFDDGNGRVARMLVNYLLLRSGYPPIIIPTEEKKAYLAALRMADAGDLAELVNYLRDRVRASLELAIRAGNGENIEEPSDVEKQVALFVKGELAGNKEGDMPTKENLGYLSEISFQPFIKELERKMEGLKPMFSKYEVVTENLRGAASTGAGVSQSDISFQVPGGQILMTFRFIRYLGEAATPFDHETTVGVHFPPKKYTITHDGNVLVSKPYSDPVLTEEIDNVTSRILAKTFGVVRGKASPRT
ncbi:Fic family protein [Haloferula sp. A504]|uniref:Fic family protein n=1 Tax=Haloferula sp. A504 TaxID=3373601 RepID=UPI0031C2A667|nr:Fic family protein [Verrucomicrobiaceae bacterium E54]